MSYKSKTGIGIQSLTTGSNNLGKLQRILKITDPRMRNTNLRIFFKSKGYTGKNLNNAVSKAKARKKQK